MTGSCTKCERVSKLFQKGMCINCLLPELEAGRRLQETVPHAQVRDGKARDNAKVQ